MTHHKDFTHHSHHSSSSSPQDTVCVLTDHQPINHQETELSDISEITEAVMVNAITPKEERAQNIISATEDQRAQTNIAKSNTEVIEVEIHAEETDAQHIVHFEEAQDRSDAGSLITQAPLSNPIHTTINALSTWISAVQPRESWYLAGWIKDSPIDFLVDPGAVVSAISLQCYEKLIDADAILTPLKAMQMELEAANKSDMRVHGMCSLELSVHGLLINIDPRNIDPRNIDPRNTYSRNIDPRNRDHHDARDRSRDHRSNERPTHEDDRGDSSDAQRNSYHSGMSNSMSRPSSSPKVPTFDGTVSAQFRPWIIQFEAIARHQCWTLGER